MKQDAEAQSPGRMFSELMEMQPGRFRDRMLSVYTRAMAKTLGNDVRRGAMCMEEIMLRYQLELEHAEIVVREAIERGHVVLRENMYTHPER